MRILLVEDSRLIGEAVKDHIATTRHVIDWVFCLEDAAAAVGSVGYGLILLDLQLPDGDGISFLTQIRRSQMSVPVIILTARDQVTDRIEGLNAGADDYLIKPFDLGELEARIAAVSRRYDGQPRAVLQFGDMEIDRPHHLLAVAGDPVVLTSREWAVLDLLVARPGVIVPKGQFEEALYEFGAEIESNTVEVYVSRLRKKVGKEKIRTIRGIGYLLEQK